MNKKSDGILVLGVMAVLFGVWSLLHYLAVDFVFLKNPHLLSQLQSKGMLSSKVIYFGLISNFVIYSLFIIGGVAILKLKNWGRNVLILISIIQLANSLIYPYIWKGIMSGATNYAIIPSPTLILYVINIWFFNRRATKEQFIRIP